MVAHESITNDILEKNLNKIIKSKVTQKVHDVEKSYQSSAESLITAREKFASAELKYKTLYEESLVLYRTINRDGIVINCNKAYAKALGYSKEELIGTSIFLTTTEDTLDAMKNSFETWKKTGRVKNREVWLKRKDGTRFPTLISANNLYDRDGTLIGSNTVIQDISEFYKIKENALRSDIMKEQIDELKVFDRLKDEFSSMITHELRTPLASIKGHCEILNALGSSCNFTADQADSVNEIYRSATRLERLITDVLDSQKLEMNHMKFNYDTFNLTEFMNNINKNFTKIMKEKEIKFISSVKENLSLTIYKYRIRQVIDNLILNSADFTPLKTGKIEIGATSDGKLVQFHVKDNGIGIPTEMQPEMFKKFYQADTSPTRKHAGTGLGLVVCKGIVEALGGDIWFESESGKGTTFFFTIPINKAKDVMK